MDAVFWFLWAVLRIMVPYVFTTLGGTVCERSGIVNIGLEGILLISAFFAALGATAGPVWAVGAGVAAGVTTAALFGVLTVVFRGDQIVCGVALFLLADGLSRYLLKVVFGSTSNSPRLLAVAGHSTVWLVVLAVGATLILHGVFYKTAFGLRLRAVGDGPKAAQALSVSVGRVRFAAVVLSGLLTSLGGVYLLLEQKQFVALMSGGRGFISLAAMIFGGWRPVPGALAAVLFAAAEATGIFLQAQGLSVPNWVLQGVPYALTLLTLLRPKTAGR